MGCDIHVVVEGRWSDAGDWDPLCESLMPSTRDYRLFSMLAGVRSCEGWPEIDTPRGLPSDASQITQRMFLDSRYNLHSWSWISAAEFELFIRPKAQEFGNFVHLVTYLTTLYYGQEYTFRVIFAFDN